MQPSMISRLEQITPEWLSQALGVPPDAIVGIEQRANDAFNSSIAHLIIIYRADAPVTVPDRLVVKLNANGDGFDEVAFYRTVMALPDAQRLSMLVRCYAADADPSSGHSYCLLQDISETHQPVITRQQTIDGKDVPPSDRLEQVVEAIAGFHAYWWQHPLLGKGMAQTRWWYRDESFFERHVLRRQTEWAKFKGSVGDWFPADLTALYEQTLARLPNLWEAYLKGRVLPLKGITLSNGDCYLSQFLTPKDSQNSDVYLVDFQDVSANFGPYDLVYMFATFWTNEQRHEANREERLLHCYLTALQSCGIGDYGWDDLYFDYQMMVVFMIFDPVWNQTSGSAQTYWWPKLQRLTASFRDLRCAEALDRLLGT